MNQKRSYRNTKPRVFIFFLGLAILFWVLTKFSKDISGTSSAVLQYNSIPPQVILADTAPQNISFDVTANGFTLLLYKLRSPEIPIELSSYYEEGMESIRISNEQLLGRIQRELGSDIIIRNLQPASLEVPLDQMVNKRVRVIPQTNITFREGFRALDSAQVTPDSVEVRAPRGVIDSITSVRTQIVTADDVSEALQATVALDVQEDDVVSWNPRRVTLTLDVAEFVQKEILVPVQLINVPSSVSLKLVPEKVLLNMNIPIDRFQQLSASDFSVVCDYAERNKEENFMIPELLKKPDWLHDVEFEDKKIDYLIFK